jgi:hypothetical protein
LLLALAAWAVLASVAAACPFCTMQGQTLTGEVSQASMVLYGTLTNAQIQGNGEDGTTDLVIEKVVKKHDDLDKLTKTKGNKTFVVLPRYVPPADGYKYLVFCDVFKGKVDPYRGVAVKADSDMAKYLEGALAVKDKKIGERLRFFFDYLDNADLEISNDAYKEFANADYKDYRDMAAKLPADKVARWLKDDKTPGFRYGLYASMLGHCGKPEHAALLREMLEPEKRVITGVDGILAGYVLLSPKEGWAYTVGVLKDAKQDFLFRYAALRTVRFLHDSRPDVVAKKDLVAGVLPLLEQEDIVDLVIEDLRRWECWDLTDRVLGVCKTKAYEVPIVRKAILRFCLSNPQNPAAARYIGEQRKKDPEGVDAAAELLKVEQSQTPGTNGK